MTKDVVHTETYKGLTIEIYYDEYAENPFTAWDGEPDIIGYHRQYNFNTRKEDANKSPDEFLKEAKQNGYLVKPLYAYIHGGIAFSTARAGQFSCRWDSGMFGFIFWTRGKIETGQGAGFCKRLTKAKRATLDKQLESAVELLNDYAQGRVYGFAIKDKSGEIVDSCCGFYGHYEDEGGALDSAKSEADYHAQEQYKNEARDIEADRPDMYGKAS